MSINDTRKPSLDEVLESIRSDEPSPAEIVASADRVRAKLGIASAAVTSSTHIESCAGFQALIPGYLERSLPAETALLLEDHSRECIPCRRALIAARTPKSVPATGSGTGGTRPAYLRWTAAAGFAALLVLGAYSAWRVMPMMGADPQLKVMRVDGALYQLAAGGPVPLRVGMKVSAKNAVRTTKDGGALLMMDDGSRIELYSRTELTVARRRDGSTVRLAGGAIIVEASPQGSGHLDVRTDDCLVAVKGTIFSVNTGTKGSRVSVVEGAVRVAADGRESLLKPGDQMTTSNAVTAVSVGDEIAWSKDAARYAQLLTELASLQKDLEARVPAPGMRYESKILDRMPQGTILYAAIPNLTDALSTAKTVFEEHVAQSGALQAWWNQNMSSAEHRKNMDEAFEKVKTLGSQLGDEIVIALARHKDGTIHGPILMAEVKDRAAFRRTLAKEMSGVSADASVRDASLKFEGSIVRIEFAGAHMAVGDAVPLASWESSPFHEKLAAAYADGTSWLFGVDLKAMLSHAQAEVRAQGDQGARFADQWEKLGVLDAQYLIFERTESSDEATLRGEIVFDQPRHGLVGWLAAPAPMGAAEFISPDAAFAAAAVVKRPEELLADVLSLARTASSELPSDTDVATLRALAATLGGDVAIALDGPVLPIPSWKVVIEVNDPVGFQTAFEALIAHINDRIAAEGRTDRIVLSREETGNRTDWIVRFTAEEVGQHEMRYTFVDGYLIAAPSLALIDRAIEQHANGYTLTRSRAFMDLLSADGHVNVSAFAWEHLGPTVGPLASRLSGVIASAEMKAVEAMAAESRPRLITAYGEDDRIVIGARGERSLGSLLGSMISAQNLGAMLHVVTEAGHSPDQARGAAAQ